MKTSESPASTSPSEEHSGPPTGGKEIGWIRTVAPAEATGRLRKLYDQALERAGRVFHVLRIQSLQPATLDASTRLYTQVMRSPRGALTRVQRELLATVVSHSNDCFY